MSKSSVDVKFSSLVKEHYRNLNEVKNRINFKKLDKGFLFENYYVLHTQSNDTGNILNWVMGELISNTSDVLVIFDNTTFNKFKTFTSDLYKGIGQEDFNSVSSRVFKYDDIPREPYVTNGQYKMIVLGYINTRFKSKLFLNASTKFKEIELIFGIN